MFFFGLAFELFVEVWHCLHCVFTKPTMTRIFIQHVTRGRTGEKLSPIVENTLNNVLTLSLRKAANPAVVTIGQFRIPLMGTTTKSVLLYSGAEVMMWSIKIIISCQEGILVPFEKPGSLYCCQKIWLKNTLISGSEMIAFNNSWTVGWKPRSSSVPWATIEGVLPLAVSSSSAGGWRAINNANLFLYLILTSMIKLANQEEMNLRSEEIHWPTR